MFQDEVQCPVCHVVADPFGDHHVGCGGNGDRILRHNALRDAVFSSAQSAALAPQREVPSLIPNSQSQPADIFLPCWKRDQPAALDVTVISTMQRATVNGAASTQGHALLVGEARKMLAHDACAAAGITFVPIVMETLGGMSALTVDTLARSGHLLGRRLGVSISDSVRHCFNDVPFQYGGDTLLCGYVGHQSSPPQWMEFTDFPFPFFSFSLCPIFF